MASIENLKNVSWKKRASITPSTAAPSTVAANDDIVSQINGNFGYWQLRTIILIFLCKIPSAWFMACVIYTAPTAQKGEYYCKPTTGMLPDNGTALLGNAQANEWIRRPHASQAERNTDRQFSVDACNIYEMSLEHRFAATYNNYSNPFVAPTSSEPESPAVVKVIPCDNFEHNTEYQSLVTQFDLVCSRQLLVSMTQSFHALGAVFGGLLAYKALQHISPRRLMLCGMFGQIFFGNLTGLVNTFQLHVYFRCLTSLFCALMYTSGQQILADITGGKVKTIVTTLFELFWSIGLILLPAISIFFDSWSYLYVAISSSLVVLVFLHRWIADSPRWLLKHNKIEQALQLMLESATYNNRNIPLNLEAELNSYAKELKEQNISSYWSVWDGKTKFKFLFAIHWTWVGAGILYNVMLLLIRSLGIEHIHVNTAAMGFAEMFGVFLGLYLILYTKHRWLWAGYLTLAAGLFTYFIWLVPHSIKEHRRVGLSMIFWLALKMANSASLSVLTTCTGEMVSMEKRPMLMLSVSTFSRIILVVAPFISTLKSFHYLLPITVFATLGVINGVLMCFLNIHFYNDAYPGKQKVPSPNTFRRNSTIILTRRNSMTSDVSTNCCDNSNLYDSNLTISISDLWQLDSRFETIAEYDSTAEMDTDSVDIKTKNDEEIMRIS